MPLSSETPEFEIKVNNRVWNDIVPLSIVNVTGGARLNTATVQLAKKSEDVVLKEKQVLELEENDKVEIRIKHQGEANELVHLGKITHISTHLAPRFENIIYQSTLSHHMFGDILDRIPMVSVNPESTGTEYMTTLSDSMPVTFNPTVEGIPVPNMFIPELKFISHKSIDPEAFHIWRKSAERGENETIGFWTLRKIIDFLLQLNSDAEYVLNPTSSGLRHISQSIYEVRDLTIRRGRYLPQLLDDVLTPYGYYHFIQFRNNKPEIVIEERGRKDPIELKLQKVDEHVDPSSTEVWKYRLNADMISQSANRIITVGDTIRQEGTFILQADWNPILDDTDMKKLVDGDTWKETPGYKDVWRKWVLNEGQTSLWADKFDLDPFFNPNRESDNAFADEGEKVAREASIRRRFLPCLTMNKDHTPVGNIDGCYIEYWDPTAGNVVFSTGEGSTSTFSSGESTPTQMSGAWRPLIGSSPLSEDGPGAGMGSGGMVRVLDEECGIRFSSDEQAPEDLISLWKEHGLGPGDDLIRITATIESTNSLRWSSKTGVDEGDIIKSHLKDEKIHYIYAPDKFQKNVIHESSIFKQAVENGDLISLETDQEVAIGNFTISRLSSWNQSEIHGDVLTHSILPRAHQYIGATIKGFTPRGIGLLTTPRGADKKYPVVTAVSIDVDEGTLSLQLDTHRTAQ